jgi:multimeric flavodoxin WrbA
MNIVAINSSYRGDSGYTRILLDKIGKGVIDAGATYEIITLAKYKINRCLDCGTCHTKEHYLKCIYEEKDDVKVISEKLAQANIIIYSTPTYVFGISGLLKLFIDRIVYSSGNVFDLKKSKRGLLFHHVNDDICSKPFVTLICSDNIEDNISKSIIHYFKTFSIFMDAPQIGLIVRNGGVLIGYGKSKDKEKNFPKIYQVHKAFEQAGHELVLHGHIRMNTQNKMNKEIINVPFFSFIKNFKFLKQLIVKIARKEMLKL